MSKALLSGRCPLCCGSEIHALLAPCLFRNLKLNLGLKPACPPMASGMSKSVIWGTAVGAAVIMLVMGSILIILCWRSRGRARIDQAYAVGERRPNEYLRGHFSITDADVVRMPGSRTVNRCSPQRIYGPTGGYTSMAARENSLSRPILRALPVEMANRQPSVTTTPSWPALPRQLTKSSTAQAGKVENAPLNPITEKSLMVRLDDSPRQIEQELTRQGQKKILGVKCVGRVSKCQCP